MAGSYASAILEAPVETVWSLVRDFNGLASWAPGIARSEIEEGLDPDVVGCVRSLRLADGAHVRERLLTLDDANYTFAYRCEMPSPPATAYIATVRLYPVTHTDETFAEWEADIDAEEHGRLVSGKAFSASWANLADIIAVRKPSKPQGAVRWKGFAPNKAWTSRAIRAPVDEVWGVMRDFAGMGAWHEDITKMHMLGGVRSDKVSGIRDFYFGEGHLNEELLHLCDRTRSFSYRITECEIPWINYVSGSRLWPVTAGNTAFGVWTGDWDASPQDDLVLIPRTEQNVYQKAFATVERKLRGR